MRFAEKTIILKDGRTCVLKPPAPEMAEEMIRIMRRAAGETPFLSRYPDEVDLTPEGEAEFLAGSLESTESALVIAEVNGTIAGYGGVHGNRTRRKIRHRCTMGISLSKEYWGLGIGTAVIGYMGELAKQAGYEQMELLMVADNERAGALYRKCGFTECGRQYRGMKFDDGTYHDEILMYKIL